MKKNTLLSILILCAGQMVSAQAVTDTVITGNAYLNNVWYSLENDNQSTAVNNNWDIALSTSINPTNALTTSILFNYKSGLLYEIPGSSVANFATVDTAGFSGWVGNELFNSDTTWTIGALNTTTNLGSFDYGWGTYNSSTHTSIDANRVFLIKYNNGSFKKFYIDLSFSGGYTVTFANLDNTAQDSEVIPLTAYATKNFVYYSLSTSTVVDREPAADTWDLTFMQYPNIALGGYPVAGVLHNHGTQSAKVYPIGHPETYTDISSAQFSNKINTIGYNWKALVSNAYVVEDSLAYIVKTKSGDFWRIVFTGFISGSGTPPGEYIFSKELLTSLSVAEAEAKPFLSVYPNPASQSVAIVIDNTSEATVNIYSLTGSLVHTTTVSESGLQTLNIPVSDLDNGLYQVVYTTGKAVNTQKLFVQH